MKAPTQELIDRLQSRILDEGAARDQYLAHAATLERFGLTKLAAQKREHATEEAKHRDLLMDRVALFEVEPQPQDSAQTDDMLGTETAVPEMLDSELSLENEARTNYNADIAFARLVNDNDTADLLTQILKDETDHTREIEISKRQLAMWGEQNFYAAQGLG